MSEVFQTPTARLRALIAREIPATIPLALDPISAKIAERAGFEALYLGGGTLGYVKTGTEANLSLTQMVQAGIEIRAASTLPLILDGQCGWGDAMHVRYTMNTAEAAGFAAIEIEDQLMPKRAHHHIGIEHLIPVEHMVEKIKVAVSARRDPNFIVIGRTNACRTPDIDDAVRRAEAYKNAGADMLLILPKTPEEARTIGERVEGPLLYMALRGIASIGMTNAELGRLGYRLVVESLTPFYAAQRALRLCYESLARGEQDPALVGDIEEENRHIHAVIGLPDMLAIERRTVEG